MTVSQTLTTTLAAALTGLLLAFALMGSSAVYAEGSADTDGVSEAAKAEKKRRSKLVCKRERKTGTRVREKVCRSVGQIEDRAKRDRNDVDLMTRNARPGNLGE